MSLDRDNMEKLAAFGRQLPAAPDESLDAVQARMEQEMQEAAAHAEARREQTLRKWREMMRNASRDFWRETPHASLREHDRYIDSLADATHPFLHRDR